MLFFLCFVDGLEMNYLFWGFLKHLKDFLELLILKTKTKNLISPHFHQAALYQLMPISELSAG